MPTNFIILIAAIVVALIVFRALLSLLKTAISSAVAIFVIVVILTVFGFKPQDLINEVTHLPQILKHLVTGGK
ncbi:MAG: hypothetical protein PUP93_27760 [Rhizonema sp. NSF051]|nr:hypothetical protein [Rhizonema sp. NSF051]